MSHYGVKIGCYKYHYDCEIGGMHGQIVHIKSLTKYFVGYDIYNYYDNKYSLHHLQSPKHSCDKKKVKQLSGVPYQCGASLFINTNNQYELKDENFVVEEEQPVVEDDGTAENDLDDLEACEYKKEVECCCPKRHITEWGDYGYKYTLDKKWVKEVLDFLDTTYLNNSLMENRQFVRKLLTNNDRIYDNDRILIERFVEFLKTDFMTTNVFLVPC